MEKIVWDEIKQFYRDKFDIEPEIVDLFCDFSVLLLCVSGSSNKSISEFLDIDIDEVENVNQKYFGFGGWIKDLPINPIRLYKEGKVGDAGEFITMICERFIELEKVLNDNWI